MTLLVAEQQLTNVTIHLGSEQHARSGETWYRVGGIDIDRQAHKADPNFIPARQATVTLGKRLTRRLIDLRSEQQANRLLGAPIRTLAACVAGLLDVQDVCRPSDLEERSTKIKQLDSLSLSNNNCAQLAGGIYALYNRSSYVTNIAVGIGQRYCLYFHDEPFGAGKAVMVVGNLPERRDYQRQFFVAQVAPPPKS